MSSTNVMGARPQGYKSGSSTAYESAHAVRAAAGTMLFLAGYNSGPDQFIQVHDLAAAPAGAAVPVLIVFVPSLSNFSFVVPVGGWPVANGIQVVNSTTGPTYTAGAADCWFEFLHCN